MKKSLPWKMIFLQNVIFKRPNRNPNFSGFLQKKTKKGYELSPEKTNKNSKEDIERFPMPIPSPSSTMDSGRRSELTRSSTYNGPSSRPGPSIHQETKNSKKSTLPLPKRLSKRGIEDNPSVELSQ